jgi:hypothetical protein
MMVDAPGFGRYESVDVIAAGVYDQSIELDGRPQIEQPLLPLHKSGKEAALERACSRTLPASH